MLESCRLPFTFDVARLRADLEAVAPGEWVAHYNTHDYEGDWAGVALRSVGGQTGRLYAKSAIAEPFADTALLARCPYLREVLAQFQCPLRAVRLLRLRPGARVREHCDHQLGLEDGEARLHVPITTNPEVDFVVNGHRRVMNPGETWYVNFNLPHRVFNHGTTDRVHLVIDCEVNDWLLGLLPPEATTLPEPAEAAPPAPPPLSFDRLERLRQRVLDDPELLADLRATTDREVFVRRVVGLSQSWGCPVTARDVEEAMRASMRAWLERLIV